MTSKSTRVLVQFVACLLLITGASCRRSVEETRPTVLSLHGQHGGHTFSMSDDRGYEMEFTLDDKRRRMVIYVYGTDTQEPHSLDAKSLDAEFVSGDQAFEVTFMADPRRNDPDGSSSRFELSLDQLPQQLMSSNDFKLNLSFSDVGQEVTGSIMHNNDHVHDYHHD